MTERSEKAVRGVAEREDETAGTRAIKDIDDSDYDQSHIIEMIQKDADNRKEMTVADYEFVVARNHSFRTDL